jgi:quercetin dioxygenase-like cupin family protein
MALYSVWDIKGVRAPKPHERVLKIIMSPETTGTKELTLLVSIIPPNSTTGNHTHDGCEIMYLAHGRGEFVLEGRKTPVQADQVVYAPEGVAHQKHWGGISEADLLLLSPPKGGRPHESSHGSRVRTIILSPTRGMRAGLRSMKPYEAP